MPERYTPLFTVWQATALIASVSGRRAWGYRSVPLANAPDWVSRSIVMPGKLLLTIRPACRSRSTGTEMCPS